MRLTSSLLLPVLASLVSAATDSGHLFIWDGFSYQGTTSRTVSWTITPETARLVLASRLGLDQSYELGNANEEVLSAINTYAGWQPLFGDGAARGHTALLLAQGDDAFSKSERALVMIQ